MKSLYLVIVSISFILVTGFFSGLQAENQLKHDISLKQIRQSAQAEERAMEEFLIDTIKYASVENFGYSLEPETEKLMDFVLDKAKSMGFSTSRAADGLVGIIECGKGEEVVGALIHLDVVPASGEGGEKWEHPPFSGEKADGYIWGRGSQDNKGALAGVLYAAKILMDNKLDFKRKFRIILGTKEEKNFEGLTRYFKENKQPDYGIVPDGIFIMQGEKGLAQMDFTFHGMSSDEHSAQRDTVVYWDGGTVINSVPDFSYVVIRSKDVPAARSELTGRITQVTDELKSRNPSHFYGVMRFYYPDLYLMDYDVFVKKYSLKGIPEGDLVLFSKGVAFHGSAPWGGKNAIVETALVGSLMSNLSDNAYKRAFRFVASRIGLSTDGSGLGVPFIPTGMPVTSPYNTPIEYYGTSANLGLVKVEQNDLILSIDYRIGLNNTIKQVVEGAKKAVEQFDGAATVRKGSVYESFYYSDEDPLLQIVKTSYKEVKGWDSILITSPASTYNKLVKDFIGFGPVDISHDPTASYYHMTNERMSIDMLSDNLVLYAHVLQKMIQVEDAPVRR